MMPMFCYRFRLPFLRCETNVAGIVQNLAQSLAFGNLIKLQYAQYYECEKVLDCSASVDRFIDCFYRYTMEFMCKLPVGPSTMLESLLLSESFQTGAARKKDTAVTAKSIRAFQVSPKMIREKLKHGQILVELSGKQIIVE
ncbi:hypothetical protein AB6A40_000028 [Gnathostoma spinigerum]|uniref:Uncharacterized protein n=1 Tax=Gnathostoma spinigerum TaxID=75299 RepID=A0ABD6E183_9BILA